MTGLTNGLLDAGAERVVVSLWSVRDDATRALMNRFYGLMLDQKNTFPCPGVNPGPAFDVERPLLANPLLVHHSGVTCFPSVLSVYLHYPSVQV